MNMHTSASNMQASVATFADWNEYEGWVIIKETHASVRAARIRAKVNGWSLLSFGNRSRSDWRL